VRYTHTCEPVCVRAAVWVLISGVAYLVLDACHGNLFVLRFAFSCHKCRRRTFVTFPLHFYFNNLPPSIYGMYTHTFIYKCSPAPPCTFPADLLSTCHCTRHKSHFFRFRSAAHCPAMMSLITA